METRNAYISPEIEIINIEIECSIMNSSGTARIGVEDWEDLEL